MVYELSEKHKQFIKLLTVKHILFLITQNIRDLPGTLEPNPISDRRSVIPEIAELGPLALSPRAFQGGCALSGQHSEFLAGAEKPRWSTGRFWKRWRCRFWTGNFRSYFRSYNATWAGRWLARQRRGWGRFQEARVCAIFRRGLGENKREEEEDKGEGEKKAGRMHDGAGKCTR